MAPMYHSVSGVKPSRYNIIVPLTDGKALAYNAASRALAVWNEKDRELYSRITARSGSIENESLADMIYGGFAVSEEIDELARVEQRYRESRFSESSLTLTVVPTLKCNFACDYCFQGQRKPKGSMSQKVQDALVNHIESSLKNLKTLHIVWYGGEPLLEKQIIYRLSDRIIQACEKAGVAFSAMIVTNGWLLEAEVLEQLYTRRVRTVQVTLDGAEEYHDSRRVLLSGKPTFSRIVENIKSIVTRLDQYPIQLHIRVNVDARNEEGIEGLLTHLAESGLVQDDHRKPSYLYLYFAPVEAVTVDCHSCAGLTLNKKHYSQREAVFYRRAVEKGLSALPFPPVFLGRCMAVRPSCMIVLPSGELHKCWETVSTPESKIGTIFEADRVARNRNYRQWLEWSPFKYEPCRQCVILPNCVGFCAYKFLYRDSTMGEAASLPCPSWKYNIKERLFLRAEKLGFISPKECAIIS
jgi:uncharacterized protein